LAKFYRFPDQTVGLSTKFFGEIHERDGVGEKALKSQAFGETQTAEKSHATFFLRSQTQTESLMTIQRREFVVKQGGYKSIFSSPMQITRLKKIADIKQSGLIG